MFPFNMLFDFDKVFEIYQKYGAVEKSTTLYLSLTFGQIQNNSPSTQTLYIRIFEKLKSLTFPF